MNGKSQKTEWLEYAAERSHGNARQWRRYLRKIMNEDGIRLSGSEIADLLASDSLDMFQKIYLKSAAEPGSITQQRIAAMNQKFEPRILKAFLESKGQTGNE